MISKKACTKELPVVNVTVIFDFLGWLVALCCVSNAVESGWQKCQYGYSQGLD